MKQLDFKELKVRIGIEEIEIHDLRKEVGNSLYRLAETVPMAELAKKIYYSDGVMEITDDDFDKMMDLFNGKFKRFIIDSINENVKNIKEVEE